MKTELLKIYRRMNYLNEENRAVTKRLTAALPLEDAHSRRLELKVTCDQLAKEYARGRVSLDAVQKAESNLRSLDSAFADSELVVTACKDQIKENDEELAKLEHIKGIEQRKYLRAFSLAQIDEFRAQHGDRVTSFAALESLIGGFGYQELLSLRLLPSPGLDDLVVYQDQARELIKELLADEDESDDEDESGGGSSTM